MHSSETAFDIKASMIDKAFLCAYEASKSEM